MKLVVNRCSGGFDLSHKAVLRYLVLRGFTPYWEVDKITRQVRGDNYDPEKGKGLVHYGTQPDFMTKGNPGYFSPSEIPRDDPVLLKVISELGEEANGSCAELEVVEIPDGIEWEIEEYDGLEHVAEQHRIW